MRCRTKIAVRQVDPGVDLEVFDPEQVPAPVLEDETEVLALHTSRGIHRKVYRGAFSFVSTAPPARQRQARRG